MWLLKSHDCNKIFYCLGKSEFPIGRSADVCDFVLQGDTSISRKHAIVYKDKTDLYIQDLGSRYGTFINEGIHSKTMIDKGEKIKLNNGDKIRFGILGNLWIVEFRTFITCTSTMKGENLINLQETLEFIDGVLKDDWSNDCNYLTMPAITLTLKVLHALVSCAHIVKPNFWNECITEVQSKRKLPDPKKYTPALIEDLLNQTNANFYPNEARTKIFSGKKIIFFSRRQMNMYKDIFMKSSGIVALLSECKMTKNMLCDESVIVIQYVGDGVSQNTQQINQITAIVKFINSKSKRVIPESEICLAVLYCSIEKYCNPSYHFSIEKDKNEDRKPQVLVEETQELVKTNTKIVDIIINESLVSMSGSNEDKSIKRKINSRDEGNTVNQSKKFKGNTPLTEGSLFEFINEPTTSRTIKRPADDNCDNRRIKMAKVNQDTREEKTFAFIEDKNEINDKTEKKLSFLKPPKAKQVETTENENLFNFVQTEAAESQQTISSHGSIIIPAQKSNHNDEPVVKVERKGTFEIKPSTWISCSMKKEISDISKKESDFGSTIVVVRDDLIKRMNTCLNLSGNSNNSVKNYKKFKKVLPLHMQVTVIPVTQMSMYKEDTSNIEFNQNFVDSDDESEQFSIRPTITKKSSKRTQW